MNTRTAFAIFQQSFTAVPSRQNISTLHYIDAIPVVHSDYMWEGARRVTDDFFIHDRPPNEVLTAVRAYQPTPVHYLLVIDDQPNLLAEYTAQGYQLAYTEYLMARSLANLPPLDIRYDVLEVRTETEMDTVNVEDSEIEPWVRVENLASPAIHHYCIKQDQLVGARARSWQYSPHSSYVTHVFTHPNYRRRGLARAIMIKLLWDGAARGETESVLVASESGDLLYRDLGYERLAKLLVFQPADSPLTKQNGV